LLLLCFLCFLPAAVACLLLIIAVCPAIGSRRGLPLLLCLRAPLVARRQLILASWRPAHNNLLHLLACTQQSGGNRQQFKHKRLQREVPAAELLKEAGEDVKAVQKVQIVHKQTSA
jgi:hypothetical protein